ncbi:MAG TPA: hypothetical protein VGW75_06830 [Solirubrobacteraceae bacterium]|jgi:hypothetical protein|nr:hypothetical protein [Solirubrobacteraceae bacterium]
MSAPAASATPATTERSAPSGGSTHDGPNSAAVNARSATIVPDQANSVATAATF